MKISVISFTETGQQLAERIRESMDGETAVTLYTKCSRLEKKTVPAVDDSDADTICVRNSQVSIAFARTSSVANA